MIILIPQHFLRVLVLVGQLDAQQETAHILLTKALTMCEPPIGWEIGWLWSMTYLQSKISLTF